MSYRPILGVLNLQVLSPQPEDVHVRIHARIQKVLSEGGRDYFSNYDIFSLVDEGERGTKYYYNRVIDDPTLNAGCAALCYFSGSPDQ